ncbi:MAG: TAT-variant-translocated molybdopterin oxidoreductase, partial [Tepidisphaeraceae bacterium]
MQVKERKFWRSLDELAGDPRFAERVRREFPSGACEWTDPVSRRNFLALMGASLALAGIGGCVRRDPEEKIVPYVQQPEEIIPGRPLFYATAIPIHGYGRPVLVESHMGRPTKIEGNPQHPASLGSTDAMTQASILSLYDPDRSQVVTQAGRISTFDALSAHLSRVMDGNAASRGRGMRVLSEPILSPTLAWQAAQFLTKFPEARWHEFTPVSRDNIHAGAKLAFGEPAGVVYRFDKADVIVSLDSDFLADEPGSVRYARDFVDRRRVRRDRTEMNRLYVVESTISITGAMADHRLPLAPDLIYPLAAAIARALGVAHQPVLGAKTPAAVPESFVRALVADLSTPDITPLVLAGPSQPAEVHAICHAINAHLHGAGQSVVYTAPVEMQGLASLAALVDDIHSGKVNTLFILGGNPVYNAPADLEFAKALDAVPLRIHLGPYNDETSYLCHWHVPMLHALEQWSDACAYDGTATLIQPLIGPLYEGHSIHDFVARLCGRRDLTGREIVRAYWKERYRGGDDFERFWQKSLHDGFVADTALPARKMPIPPGGAVFPPPATAPSTQASLRLVIRPDPNIGDGSFSNNGWLQELPKPITRLTWDNAALMSPRTAARLGVQSGGGVNLTAGARSLASPVAAWIVPGHPDDCVTVHLGYGRRRAGATGTGHGFSAYALRTTAAPWFAGGLQISPTNATFQLACTQLHQLMENRDLVRVHDIEDFRKSRENDSSGQRSFPLTMYKPWDATEPNQWGMVIDINACIGCNACVVACQSENNIPVVGKDQVLVGREMQWLRIDTYFSSEPGDSDRAGANPQTYFQPLPC